MPVQAEVLQVGRGVVVVQRRGRGRRRVTAPRRRGRRGGDHRGVVVVADLLVVWKDVVEIHLVGRCD